MRGTVLQSVLRLRGTIKLDQNELNCSEMKHNPFGIVNDESTATCSTGMHGTKVIEMIN